MSFSGQSREEGTKNISDYGLNWDSLECAIFSPFLPFSPPFSVPLRIQWFEAGFSPVRAAGHPVYISNTRGRKKNKGKNFFPWLSLMRKRAERERDGRGIKLDPRFSSLVSENRTMERERETQNENIIPLPNAYKGSNLRREREKKAAQCLNRPQPEHNWSW